MQPFFYTRHLRDFVTSDSQPEGAIYLMEENFATILEQKMSRTTDQDMNPTAFFHTCILFFIYASFFLYTHSFFFIHPFFIIQVRAYQIYAVYGMQMK